ncbi:GNAT family N-acetyltransferase [Hymenobacter aerilatus]|uniref:GNAT family N-acetyltransferase n=1 Tax=Hymenobacter aerilatus TaxID=2932251 RepID=A0A8T9T0X9_9BACT|nr:GNAT family N-acetyltransferase [Hymenobacter aerilatus]UOR07291.1 GNAT family N-acetyltransferase [Hymenobacter aerilatus]
MLLFSASLSPLDDRYWLRCAVLPTSEPTLPLAYEPYLYLRPAYLALHPAPGEVVFFYLEDHQQGQTVGHWPLVIAAQHAHSSWQAPFGGVQIAPSVPATTVRAFVTAAHQALAAAGVGEVHLRAYPTSYDEAASALLLPVFEELSYRTTLTETNYTLPLAHSFEDGLHPSARRRLRKCHQHGLRVEQETPLFLPLAYEFMQQCRQEKGLPPVWPLEQLQAQFRAFPNDQFLFSVRDATGTWAALTVLIRLNDEVLYCIHPASSLQWNTFSPVILLMQGLHAFGQASGYRLLDLGTATFPTGPSESLLTFRRHLGGVSGPRLTLEWQSGEQVRR